MSAVKGYADGYKYGEREARRTSPERRRSNDQWVKRTDVLRRESETRAFWLGFRRAMRAG